MKIRRGFSLGVVLVLVVMMATMGTAMVALFTTNLNLLQASNNGQVAFNEAESGLSQVLLDLAADPDYGTHDETWRRTLTSGFSNAECYHEISFNSSQTAIPYSTNAKAGATTGYAARPVPADCVHVISVGFCRGQVRTVEAMVKKPPFSYALASSGPINSASPFRVEGVDSRASYVQGTSSPLPGHIASNSSGGITVGAGVSPTFISGYARAVGPVSLDPAATVVEGKRPNSAPLALPSINISSFDPIGSPGLQVISSSSSNATTLSGTQRCAQTTNFTERVHLANGLLYVKGDVVFEKGLVGTGAVIAEGNVVIQSVDSQLSGTDTLAILSDKKVTLEGDPAHQVTPTVSGNYIGGLVYGEKGVDLSNVTVAGVVLTADPASTTKLDNSNLLYSADAANVTINIAQVTSSRGDELLPIYQDANGQLYFGPPDGINATQVLAPPGGASWSEFLFNNITTGNPIRAGNLTGYANNDPGAQATLSNQTSIAQTLANTNISSTPPFTIGQMSLFNATSTFMGGAANTTTAWTVVSPGSTFKLDLNNFLPRSSTLRVAAYCVHSKRI